MKKDRYIYAVLAITLVALLFNLNSWGVLEASEARYAEISREMFRSGDLFHPTLLNIYHYHKPPVTFWLTGLGFKLFGVNAFGARFFLQLSLVAQGGLVYLISQQLFSNQAKDQAKDQVKEQSEILPGFVASNHSKRSLLAALIYLSLPLTLLGARNLTTDSFLSTLVLAVMYCMSVYYCERRVWGIYGSAVMIGVGFLTKGPAIFVVPFFYWLYLMLARRVDYRVPIKHLLAALVLCVGIGLSWYVYVAHQVPGLTDYFIGRQVVARVTDDQAFNRAKPNWYYPLILLTTTLPWGVLFVISLLSARYKVFKSVNVRQISLYWIALPFVIFALSSSKLMMYLLPLYPGIALVLACLLSAVVRSDLRRLTQVFFVFYGVIGAIALVGPIIAQRSGVALAFTAPMVFSALLLLLTPSLIGRFWRPSHLRLGLMALGGVLAIAIYGGYFIGANELLIGGTRPLAQFIQAQNLQDEPVMVYGKLLPSLAFNLDRDIITISDDSEGYGIERELQFQSRPQSSEQIDSPTSAQTNNSAAALKENRWKQFWIYPDQLDSKRYLERLVKVPSVLVVRGAVPDNIPASRAWMLKDYPQRETIGRWTLFYRRS